MDRSELERVYDAYAEGLFRYFLCRMRDEGEARDLLQDLFVKLARNAECLEGVESEKGFLFRMAHNLSVDRVRRQASQRERIERAGAEAESLFARSGDPDALAFRERVEEALGELPEEQRAVVYLKLWEEMTFEEIAVAERISANTAASRYRYGLDKLRAALRPLYEEL